MGSNLYISKLLSENEFQVQVTAPFERRKLHESTVLFQGQPRPNSEGFTQCNFKLHLIYLKILKNETARNLRLVT